MYQVVSSKQRAGRRCYRGSKKTKVKAKVEVEIYFIDIGIMVEKMVYSETISFSTKGFSDMINLTDHVGAVLKRSKIENGLVTVFCPGSTGAVTTIEYESGVLKDLQKAIEKIVPSDILYEHDRRWGDGNGFSHVRASLMKPGLTIPIIKGRLTLGTWQQIVFIDFDNRRRERNILVHVIGE